MAHIRVLLLSLAIAVSSVLVLPLDTANEAQAGVCDGRVYRLSQNYNPSTGAGFLALRAGPTAQATQIGELFNGMQLEIFGRRGNWLQVYSPDLDQEGWVYRRYVRDNCGW
jgi:hypothetical protein